MHLKIEKIIEYCLANNILLTNQQSLIIKIITEIASPLTANEILHELQKLNPKANRMTIHRALEILVKNGLIHKVAFNHTYKLCDHLYCKHDHHCQILVCQECGNQTEIHNLKITEALLEIGKTYNFNLANPLEITGLCTKCQVKGTL